MFKYPEAYRLASEFLENLDVKRYWRDPEKLFKAIGWELIPYGVFDYPELSADAYSSYKNGKFFILYFEGQVKTRTNYNFHHEAGHIIAGHPIRYGESLCKSSADNEKKYLEIEATVIGRNVFLNAYIIKYILEQNRDIEKVKTYFCEKYTLSRDYIDTRFDFLDIDLNSMIYPEWVENEAKVEYVKFSMWSLKKFPSFQFIEKYIDNYKYTPTKVFGKHSLTIPLSKFYFEHTGQFNYIDVYGNCGVNEIEYEYTGVCENLEAYGDYFKNKKAIIKVYEYPKGEVNQVTDIELIEK